MSGSVGWYVLGAALVLGCGEEGKTSSEISGSESKTSPPAVTSTKPNQSAGSTPRDSHPAPADGKRRQRFDKRVSVPIDGLSGKWKSFVKNIQGKAIALEHEAYSYYRYWRGGRHIRLTVRAFGRDAEVDDRVLKALAKLKLPNPPKVLKDHKTSKGLVEWSLRLDRVVAPTGVPRQTQVKIDWHRRPKPSPNTRLPCGKMNKTIGYQKTPPWLARALKKNSTRRRIRWEQDVSRDRLLDRQFMLYHNGFSHDENVGLLSQILKSKGFDRQEGSGPKQLWQHQDGQTVRWHPAPRNMDVGCTLRGPVLTVTWTKPRK